MRGGWRRGWRLRRALEIAVQMVERVTVTDRIDVARCGLVEEQLGAGQGQASRLQGTPSAATCKVQATSHCQSLAILLSVSSVPTERHLPGDRWPPRPQPG